MVEFDGRSGRSRSVLYGYWWCPSIQPWAESRPFWWIYDLSTHNHCHSGFTTSLSILPVLVQSSSRCIFEDIRRFCSRSSSWRSLSIVGKHEGSKTFALRPVVYVEFMKLRFYHVQEIAVSGSTWLSQSNQTFDQRNQFPGQNSFRQNCSLFIHSIHSTSPKFSGF